MSFSSDFPAELAPNLARVALGVEYDGTAYAGWQRQNHQTNTVQQELETALSAIANSSLKTICAGRTDTGVHGVNQVVHFDTPEPRNVRAWILGTNTHLPQSIRVRWAKFIEPPFHARFSAIARQYRYVIDNRAVRPAIMNTQLTWYRYPLDVEQMQQAALALVGKHDFNSYRGVHCQAKSPVRTIQHLKVERRGGLVIIDIKANAFLLHMVRNIAGVLMKIGADKAPVSWSQEVLEARDRQLGGVTAQPFGLYLLDVFYPESMEVPKADPCLPFLL